MALMEVAARGRAVDALALTIVNDAVAARADAREGVFGHRMHVAASVSGIAFLTDRTSRAYGTHANTERRTMSVGMFVASTVDAAMKSRSGGMASWRSTSRIRSASTIPPA